MECPQERAYAHVRVADVPQHIDDLGQHIDVYVTLHDVLGAFLYGFFVRVPLRDGLYRRKVWTVPRVASWKMQPFLPFPAIPLDSFTIGVCVTSDAAVDIARFDSAER